MSPGDIALMTIPIVGPLIVHNKAISRANEIAQGGRVAMPQGIDIPCPTASMTKAEATKKMERDNISASCVFGKIENYYSSKELREEVARRGPPQFAEHIRNGHGPICRMDSVYVNPVSQEVSDEIGRDCNIANLKKEGGTVQEATGPGRGERSGAETRRAE